MIIVLRRSFVVTLILFLLLLLVLFLLLLLWLGQGIAGSKIVYNPVSVFQTFSNNGLRIYVFHLAKDTTEDDDVAPCFHLRCNGL